MLALVRLAMQVGHGARVASPEPLFERVRVCARLEARHAYGVESELDRPPFQRDGSARRLRLTLLLDVFFHRCIVSRRHLAKRTTSSSGGTAAASP